MLLIVIGAWIMVSGAAWTDATRGRIPNAWWIAGLVWAGVGGIAQWIPWSHLWWAGGAWVFYEIRAWRSPVFHPGAVSWGDVKLIVALLALLGILGVWVVLWAQIGVYLWAWVRWLGRGRQGTWKHQSVRWAPWAWIALTGWGLFFLIVR